jgi:hypothetical protein
MSFSINSTSQVDYGLAPDMSKAATAILKESNEVVKSIGKAHTVGGSRLVMTVQNQKKK